MEVIVTMPQFKGLDPLDTQFNEAVEKNRAEAERRIAFRKELLALSEDGFPDAAQLKTFVFETRKPSDFQPAELMNIMMGFRRHKSWDDMLKLVEDSTDQYFKNAPIVREFCAVASNMIGDFDRTITICEGLRAEGKQNGEVFGALGKAYLKKGDLAQSTANYEQGFLLDFEYYPGINAADGYLEQGDVTKAQNIARMVHMSCMRDGLRDTMDYWCAATALEAATITGDTDQDIINDAIARITDMDIETWQLESTLSKIKSTKEAIEAQGRDASFFDITIEKMAGAITKIEFEAQSNPNQEKTAPPIATQDQTSVAEKIDDMSYGYRGLASNFIGQHFVSGNFKFVGQLPDHSLTRTDWQNFKSVLDLPLRQVTGADSDETLLDVTDSRTFMAHCDSLIRRVFLTRERQLEDLLSPGHDRYDETVNALIDLSGIPKDAESRLLADSRTNISTIFGLGLGDCRHHAQTKQILFDIWQKIRINNHLRTAYEALEEQDFTLYGHQMEAASQIEREELRTFDVVVKAPLKTKGPYVLDRDKNGHPMIDPEGNMNVIEEHTMTMLLTRDEDYNVIGIALADSFYHDHYAWSDGAIDLDDILLTDDDHIAIPAKTMAAIDTDNGQMTNVPVMLEPTVYAGKRDQTANDEYGSLLLLGLPVSPLPIFNPAEKAIGDNDNIAQKLEVLRQWYIESGNIPDSVKNRQAPEPEAP